MHQVLTLGKDVPGHSLGTIKIDMIHAVGQMGVLQSTARMPALKASQAPVQEVSRQNISGS